MRLPLAPDGLPVGEPSQHGILTLGPDVLGWSEDVLVQPDRESMGQPWRWRQSQARFVKWWYALDEDERWLFRRGLIILPKGTGKSPVAGALADCELAGPVVYDGLDEGIAVGRPQPSPYVALAAVSEKQTRVTMEMAAGLLQSPRAAEEIPGLDIGLTRIRTSRGAMDAITSAAASNEGPRMTAAMADETWAWTRTNGGPALAQAIRGNLAKTGGRHLEFSNTWRLGEESVAEASAAYADLVANDPGKLRRHRILRWQPHSDLDDLSDERRLRAELERLYEDYPWVDIDEIISLIYEPDADVSESRRKFLNQVPAASDAWLSEPEWLGCFDPDAVVRDRDVIVLGFDGSRKRSHAVTDATALIGCRVTDGLVFELGGSGQSVWEQPEGQADWQVPVTAVEAAVHMAFSRYTVVGMYADPAKWETYVAGWEARYGARLKVKATREHPMEWWMSGGRARAVVQAIEQCHGAIMDRELRHDGSFLLTKHVLNARRRYAAKAGMSIGKEFPESPRKIDAAVAMVLAWQARLDALAAGLGRRTTSAPSRIR